ncbi:MAG: hypothetical protein AB1393_07675 [Candidatus Edwardsbacteria bacterium]
MLHTLDSDPCLQAFLHIMNLARETGSEREPFVLQALKVIRAFPQNRELVQSYAKSVERRLMPKLLKEQFHSEVPDSNVFSGSIHLGYVAENNVPVRLTLNQLNQNIFTCGRLGSGKTNLNFNIIPQVVGQGIRCEICDFKQEYRDLLTLPECRPMVILNPDNNKFNPLKPIGNPKGYIQFFWDAFQQDFNLRPETKQMLINYTDELYKLYDVYSSGRYSPTMFDLYDFLNEKTEKSSQKIYRCLEVISSIINRIGDMINCSSGYSLDNFKVVSYEMDNLSEDLRSWLLKLRQKNLFEQGLKNRERNILRNIHIFDEAKMVFGKSRIGDSTNYIKDVVTQQRALGIGLIISDQNPSELADFIRNNIYTQICFHLVHPKEIRSAAISLGGNESTQIRIARLAIPYALVSLGHYPYPFLMRIPRCKVKEHIINDELERMMHPIISQLSFIPRHSPDKPIVKIEPRTETIKEPVKPAPIQKTQVKNLFEHWMEFLNYVKGNPENNISSIYDSLGLSRRKGNKIKDQLKENSLVEEITIHTGERKRPQMRLKLTQKGEEYVNR